MSDSNIHTGTRFKHRSCRACFSVIKNYNIL